MAEKRENNILIDRETDRAIDYVEITSSSDPDFLKFELVEDEWNILLYTINELNRKHPGSVIDIPFKIHSNCLSDQELTENFSGEISNCNFLEAVDIFDFKHTTSFLKCTFSDQVTIKGFDNETEIRNTVSNPMLFFFKCHFNHDFFIQRNIDYELDFQVCSFSFLNLSKGKFHEYFRILECRVEMAFIYNTSFFKLADFSNTTFNCKLQFFHVDFFATVLFSNVQFKKEIQFLHNNVQSSTHISFENAVFERFIDISRANFYCIVNYWQVKGLLKLDKNEISRIRSSDLYLNDRIKSDKNPIIYPDKNNSVVAHMRESIRSIKDNFISRNDKISALEYQKEEMNIYAIEVSESKSNSWDRVVLFFNKWSNNHGINFSRGILFTFIISFLFLLTHEIIVIVNYEFVFKINSLRPIKEYFNLFINYTVLTNFDIPEYTKFEDNPLEKLWFYTGKIFIGFGYYQTIAAFRKFLKN